jgi:predicted DNA-binding antitoxin AbrB/MazE fold protein
MIDDFDVGKNVQYYLEGWRVGLLEGIKGKTAIIKPLNRLALKEPHVVKVQIVEEIDDVPFYNVRKIEKEKNEKESKETSEEIRKI